MNTNWLDDHLYIVAEPDQEPQNAQMYLCIVDDEGAFLAPVCSVVSDTPEDGWERADAVAYKGCTVYPQF